MKFNFEKLYVAEEAFRREQMLVKEFKEKQLYQTLLCGYTSLALLFILFPVAWMFVNSVKACGPNLDVLTTFIGIILFFGGVVVLFLLAAVYIIEKGKSLEAEKRKALGGKK